MAEGSDAAQDACGYSASDVHKVLRAAVDLAVGEGEYRHGLVGELNNNIVEYATKKISALRPPSVKTIVTCTIVQNSGGFHITNSAFWDDSTDAVVTYEFTNKAMSVVVTAYLIAC
ncbi:hypothetical protein LPJ61_000853 [Coemansia biformis]|uniref:Tctex-1 n=1 Tax=Coemansia biformis TaxID=1286918 RepID=A0A9W7YHW2_9FUNG|nr:hypothetical protein LPJ61_000853 [Coemansia biformis]